MNDQIVTNSNDKHPKAWDFSRRKQNTLKPPPPKKPQLPQEFPEEAEELSWVMSSGHVIVEPKLRLKGSGR